jgi:hypothetical protein
MAAKKHKKLEGRRIAAIPVFVSLEPFCGNPLHDFSSAS